MGFLPFAYPHLNGRTVTNSFYSSVMFYVERNKNNSFFWKKKFLIAWGCVNRQACVCVENATHAAAYSRRVINGQGFFFCWGMLIKRCFDWDLISQAKDLFYYTQNIPLAPAFHRAALIKCGWSPACEPLFSICRVSTPASTEKLLYDSASLRNVWISCIYYHI